MNYEINNLLRENNIYKEIESFEKYELTHCIAYEMGIRNEEVKKFINILDELTYLNMNVFKYKNIHGFEDRDLWIGGVIDILKEYDVYKCYSSDVEDVDKININTPYLIATKLKIELEENYYIPYDGREVIFEGMEDEIDFLSNHFEPDSSQSHHFDKISSNNPKDYYKDSYSVIDGYEVYQGAYDGCKRFNFNKIYPNFKRPLRTFNQLELPINISLPKEEILAYIEKIKDNYDNENSSIKNIFELLEEDINIDTINYKNMSAKEWADCFFIYDYYKENIEISSSTKKNIVEDIQFKLTKYNGVKIRKEEKEVKNKKDTKYKIVPYEDYISNHCIDDIEDLDDDKHYYSSKTIHQRYQLMKKLIEGKNPKYKVLVLK